MAHSKYSTSRAVTVKQELLNEVRDIYSQVRIYRLTHTTMNEKMNTLRRSERFQRLTRIDQAYVEGFFMAMIDAIWHSVPTKLVQFAYCIDGKWIDSHKLTREDNDWLRANENTNPGALRGFYWLSSDPGDENLRFWTEPVPSHTYKP